MEILISRVLVDYIIVGETASEMPDLGMIELTRKIENFVGVSPLIAVGLLFAFFMSLVALAGHWHRMTLFQSDS